MNALGGWSLFKEDIRQMIAKIESLSELYKFYVYVCHN